MPAVHAIRDLEQIGADEAARNSNKPTAGIVIRIVSREEYEQANARRPVTIDAKPCPPSRMCQSATPWATQFSIHMAEAISACPRARAPGHPNAAAQTPDVVVRIINVTQPSTDAGKVIDVTPTPKPATAIETGDPIFKAPEIEHALRTELRLWVSHGY
jgi:hypothetical protein